ncbi:MAG: LuxR family transcriptional regulator, partial [Mucilaginibacter sp.]|nr:LuxR family transcriptional regulator [Mucilaginibacter sp.]
YLKQVKQRATHEVYGEDNVCLFRIVKPLNFLRCEFVGYAREGTHLLKPSAQERELLKTKVTELAAQGHSQRQISTMLNIGLATVNRLINMGEGVGGF